MSEPTAFDRLFTVSSRGFTLDKKYFHAVYKTRVLKYKGKALHERDWGNIVSITDFFSAEDISDAKVKALSLFNLNNPSFNPLDRKYIQAEYELLTVRPITPPSFKDKDFSKIHTVESGSGHYWHVRAKVKENCKDRLPESFLGINTCTVRRRMPHFHSEAGEIAYLYHPWHGAGDTDADWFVYQYGSPYWETLNRLFYEQTKGNELTRFEYTEYTDLSEEEQEKVRCFKKLEFLDNSSIEYLDYSGSFRGRDLIQGKYILDHQGNNPHFYECGGFNHLRFRYETNRERIVKLEDELSRLEIKVKVVKEELDALRMKTI